MFNGSVILASCSFPCMNCSMADPLFCMACESGFYIMNGMCMPCAAASNCKTCDPNNPALCLSCVANGALLTMNNTATCAYCD